MYDIHFRRSAASIRDYTCPGKRGYRTLQEAREARDVSGDIVVYHNTLIAVNDPTWLWQWEHEKDCYAKKAMLGGKTPEEMRQYCQILGWNGLGSV